MKLPTYLDQPLHRQIPCDCLDIFLPVRPLFAPRERAASNLQTPATLQHFLLAASMKCTTAFVFVETDECASNPCLNGGTCVDRLDGFTCQCTDEFTGSLCDNGWLMLDNDKLDDTITDY